MIFPSRIPRKPTKKRANSNHSTNSTVSANSNPVSSSDASPVTTGNKKVVLSSSRLAQLTFAVTPSDPKALASAEKKHHVVDQAGRFRCGDLVEFATLPVDQFWVAKDHHNFPSMCYPVSVRSAKHPSRSILITPQLSVSERGLYLTYADAMNLGLDQSTASKVLSKRGMVYQHSGSAVVEVEFVSCGGSKYAFGKPIVYSFPEHATHGPRAADLQPSQSFLGIKGGLRDHAFLFHQGKVYVVRQRTFFGDVFPFLESYPLYRTVSELPYLAAPRCDVCHKTEDYKNTCDGDTHFNPRKRFSLRMCSECVAPGWNKKRATYCSTACQIRHWKSGHAREHEPSMIKSLELKEKYDQLTVAAKLVLALTSALVLLGMSIALLHQLSKSPLSFVLLAGILMIAGFWYNLWLEQVAVEK